MSKFFAGSSEMMEWKTAFRQFCQSVLITFNKENPHLHSTECAGIDNSKSTNNRKTPAVSPNSLLICSQLSDFPIFAPPYLQLQTADNNN